jgi:regulator of cell morphogenesis and NO signaling
MNLDPHMTVAEIASALPRAIPVLQRHGIDFCCGGRRLLVEACLDTGLALDQLAKEIEAADVRPAAPEIDGPGGSLAALVDHILARYHAGLRDELQRLCELADKVADVHGSRHPEHLPALQQTVRSLAEELAGHLEKEERVLFPYVRELEAASRGLRPASTIPLGLASGAIGVMEREHQFAGLALKTIDRLTDGYRPPADACGSFRALYAGLEILSADLQEHIHLENNILFTRAMSVERRLRERRDPA